MSDADYADYCTCRHSPSDHGLTRPHLCQCCGECMGYRGSYPTLAQPSQPTPTLSLSPEERRQLAEEVAEAVAEQLQPASKKLLKDFTALTVELAKDLLKERAELAALRAVEEAARRYLPGPGMAPNSQELRAALDALAALRQEGAKL